MDVEKQFYEILIKYLNIEEEDILDKLRCNLAEEQLPILYTVNDLIEHQFNDTNNNLVIEYLIKLNKQDE